MKAKLIKTGNDFLLKDENDETLAITSGTIKGRMLSLKNCQAIERGYDLDELFQKELDELLFTENLDDESDCKLYKSGMYKGVRIIFELLGDKKYSEEDVEKAIELSRETELKTGGYDPRPFTSTKLSKKEIIQSLQQNEWDVEIEMEWNPKLTRCDECGEGGYYMNDPCDHPNDCKHWSPKLDADGCLILKLKS